MMNDGRKIMARDNRETNAYQNPTLVALQKDEAWRQKAAIVMSGSTGIIGVLLPVLFSGIELAGAGILLGCLILCPIYFLWAEIISKLAWMHHRIYAPNDDKDDKSYDVVQSVINTKYTN